MIYTFNVSNSVLSFCGWRNGKAACRGELHTDPCASADELAVRIEAVLRLHGCRREEMTGVILSCVVPSFLMKLRAALALLYGGRIYIAGPGLKTGLTIRTDDPAQLGSELVCCAVAALQEALAPCLLISMDTATSFTLIDASGVLRGGAIAPGVQMGAEALATRTAQLPQIDLAASVSSVVGTNSAASVQAGVVLGAACLVDGMIDRFAQELSDSPLPCLATGRMAPLILPHCRHSIKLRENLVHEGLLLLYQRNAK